MQHSEKCLSLLPIELEEFQEEGTRPGLTPVSRLHSKTAPLHRTHFTLYNTTNKTQPNRCSTEQPHHMRASIREDQLHDLLVACGMLAAAESPLRERPRIYVLLRETSEERWTKHVAEAPVTS